MSAQRSRIIAIALLLAAALPSGVALAQNAYEDGMSARRTWETWFASIQGSRHDGAYYWSGQRSLAQPGSCTSGDASFAAGCEEAKRMLDPYDVRRRTEPQFRTGWNAYSPPTTASPAASQPYRPAPAPPVRPAFVGAPPEQRAEWQAVGNQDCNRYSPSYPGNNFFGIANPAQQASWDACLRDRSFAQEMLRRDDGLKRDAEQAEQAERDRRRLAAEADERRRLELIALEQENSPDNYCKVPSFAKIVLESMSSMMNKYPLWVKAIDIEHLRTISTSDSETRCHGTFVMTNGLRLTGTFITRKNVADEWISQWIRD